VSKNARNYSLKEGGGGREKKRAKLFPTQQVGGKKTQKQKTKGTNTIIVGSSKPLRLWGGFLIG